MSISRIPPPRLSGTRSKTKNTKNLSRIKGALLATVIILLVVVTFIKFDHPKKTLTKVSDPTVSTTQSSSQTIPAAKPNACINNSLSQLVLVSINQRHMWACNDATQVYDSSVITGMENLPADLTPVGTYHIYAKERDVYLKGSDSTGSWDDYVYYWMPFLYNQYGTYGFHDATWRAPNDFGAISPYSSNASHGCVEMPLGTAKWLYGWASIGTTVTIES